MEILPLAFKTQLYIFSRNKKLPNVELAWLER